MDTTSILIAAKIEELMKRTISEAGLVVTGKMRDSIKVTAVGTGFTINAVDYFPYVDSRYHIVRFVMNSKELNTYITKVLSDSLNKAINEINQS